METNYLIPSDYSGIRALIGPDVTPAHVSDVYLGQLPIVPTAEKAVVRKLKAADVDIAPLFPVDISGLTEAQLSLREAIKVAMMHECMVTLCLTVPQLLEQSEIEVSTEVQSIDWEKKRAFHLGEVVEQIANIISDSASTQKPVTGRQLPFGRVGTERPPENQWR